MLTGLSLVAASVNQAAGLAESKRGKWLSATGRAGVARMLVFAIGRCPAR
jgi:hypothetical protein